MLRAQRPLEGREGGDACYSCNSYIEHQPCTGARHCPLAIRAASVLLNGFFSSDVSLAAALRDAATACEALPSKAVQTQALGPRRPALRLQSSNRRLPWPSTDPTVFETTGLRAIWELRLCDMHSTAID